jgi:phosphonate transport system substrate-binding protein
LVLGGTVRRFTILLLCVIGFACRGAFAGPGDKPYEFGVLPYLPLAKIQELYGPMAADFEAKLGRPVWLSSKGDYTQYTAAINKEIYDIAFVQPFDYVVAHDKHGYLPLARRRDSLGALIVVRVDSPITTIQDLRGKTVANPPADALVSHLTSGALRDAGIDPDTGVKREYGKNQFSCMQSVLIGAADACGLGDQALIHFGKEKQLKERFRILLRTKTAPPPLFVVHKRVPQKDRDILLKTILDWSRTEEGKNMLSRGFFIPFVAAEDADYESVRRHIRAGNKSPFP